MKLLHCADLHIGKTLGEYPLLEDQRYILDQILHLIECEQVELLLLAGDLYDRSVPPAAAVAVLDDFIDGAIARGARVAAIAGNHDSAQRLQFGARQTAAGGLLIQGVPSQRMARLEMTGRDGTRLAVYLAPYVDLPRLRQLFPEREVPDMDSGYAAWFAENPLEPGAVNLLMAHGFFAPGAMSVGDMRRSEGELAVGESDLVHTGVLPDFAYVALGHLHAPQQVGERPIYYSGSPLSYSTSEAGQQKQVNLVEVRPDGQVQVRPQLLRPLRSVAVVRGSLAEILTGRLHPGRQDYVYAVVTDRELVYDSMNRLRGVYPNMLGLRLESRRRQQLEQVACGWEEIDSATQFADFYRAVKGEELDEPSREMIAQLLQKLEREV